MATQSPPFTIARAESPIIVQIGEGPAVNVSRDWYIYFWNVYQGLINGLPQTEFAVTPGASPYTYQATRKGQLIVNGGTVTAISVSRNGSTFYTTGMTQGVFQLDFQDFIRITYTVAPTLTFFPM
jgi:hypothetical protein